MRSKWKKMIEKYSINFNYHIISNYDNLKYSWLLLIYFTFSFFCRTKRFNFEVNYFLYHSFIYFFFILFCYYFRLKSNFVLFCFLLFVCSLRTGVAIDDNEEIFLKSSKVLLRSVLFCSSSSLFRFFSI